MPSSHEWNPSTSINSPKESAILNKIVKKEDPSFDNQFSSDYAKNKVQ